ncbi:hypothetical protein D9611_009467 [Ephemerocybe angulata]|uniref:Protein kinase domain-containing protein n=1 Tax=Ephemerocybe angulata TaxID=980116 RepID=A0A8H5ET92_9AGAR|nr:hypothetical protein D9611_009467 [Tulosesus angulatus]
MNRLPPNQHDEWPARKSQTPPVTRNGGPPSIQSEPPLRGVDCRHSREPIHSNITRIHQALEKTQGIQLKTMLRAMIMLKYDREDRSQAEAPLTREEFFGYGEAQLRTLVQEAVKFCNDATRSASLVGKLEELSKRDCDHSPCTSLTIGLNSILVDFHNREVGQLKRCPDEGLTLYEVGSNMILDSQLLMEVSDYKSKRKPSIYESRFEDLCNSAPDLETPTFEEMAAMLEKRQTLKQPASRGKPEVRIDWSDIISCVEVSEDQGSLLSLLRPKWEQRDYSSKLIFKDDIIQRGDCDVLHQLKPDCDHKGQGKVGTRNDLKRNRDQEDSVEAPSFKRAKVSSISEKHNHRLYSVHPGRLPSEIQCTFFGLELLRSRWDRTHGIVMSFLDGQFSLRWYDSQGCIRTQEVSLCEDELPLVVATIVLLQCFRGVMRGRASVDLKATIGGNDIRFELPLATRARWEVAGRRTVAVRPVAIRHTLGDRDTGESDNISSTTLEDCFFKWYWREETRKSERHIVDIAKERAAKYLPKEHISDVLNHLPDIHHSEDFEPLSTRHIREFGQLDTAGALVPCAMMSRRLLPMETTFQPQEVQVRLWDILRCLTLLWSLGVTHGDISLDNIMATPPNEDGRKYMVLNDFDMATVMKPGDESPPKQGSGMGGTMPFMALEVLESADGSIKRLLHQELESTFWSLAWYCHREWSWNTGTYFDVRNRKAHWIHGRLYRNPDIDMGKEYFPLLRKIGALLYIEDLELMKLETKILEGPEDEGGEFVLPFFTEIPHIVRPAKDFLLLCDKAFPRDEEYKSWLWMDFAVDSVQD